MSTIKYAPTSFAISENLSKGIIENKYRIRKCTTSGCDKKPAYVMCQVAETNQYYQYEFKDICYSVQYIKYNSLG